MSDGIRDVRRAEFLASLAAASSLGSVTAPATATGGESSTAPRGLTIQYLGTAGWILSDGTTVVLIDPYISRINGPPPPGVPQYSAPGDTRAVLHWSDPAVSDETAVDRHITHADVILVTHTHYDHVLDVPYIALRTKAAVIGTESTQNVMRAYGVPEMQLFTVRGGEDYQFPALSVSVIPSLHSALDHKHYFSSDTTPAGLKAPLSLRQIHPEGGTLAFLVRFERAHVLAFGSMNYIEREIDGLRPDVLIAGAGQSRREIYHYTPRLLHAVNCPRLVLPTHWDNFLAPYETPQTESLHALQSFIAEVKAASPHSSAVVPEYFQTIDA